MTDWYKEVTAPPAAGAPSGIDWYDAVTQPAAKPEAAPAAPQAGPRERGAILPVSWDKGGGNAAFDSDAGLIGAIKRAVTLPGDVYTGKVNPLDPAIRERTLDLAATISPAAAPLRAGEHLIPGALKAFRKQEIEAPTADALKQAASQGYDAVRGMGVDYSSQAAKSLSEGIQRNLESDGVLAELSPKTFAILKKLQDPPEGSVASLDGLIAARRSLQNAAGDFTNKTEQMAATRAIKELDRFIEAAAPESVVAGPAAAAGQAVKDARGNTAAAKRSERVTGVEEQAQLRAEASNSGQNVGNAVRQRFASLLSKPKEARGYTEKELEMMRSISRGTPLSNFTRNAGNVLGGGGGLGAAVTGGMGAAAAAAATGNPFMAGLGATLPPAMGYGLKKASTALTKRQVDALDDAIRQRSPLYRQMERDAPMEALSPEMKLQLMRSLFLTVPNTAE
jgi:hypothetical protein